MNNIGINQRGFSNTVSTLALTLVVLIFQGCGGSGANTKESTPSDDFIPVVTQTGIVAFDDASKTAQPIELFLYYPDDTLSNISWQQTTGSELVFHAEHSKGIAFTPSAAGEYSFQVSFTRNGVSETLSHTVITSDERSQISARLGHAALEGSDVSLRASIENAALTNNSIVWQQISGPTVTFSDVTGGQSAVFFKAPAVNADSLLTFTVSASDGATEQQDTIAILVENAATISSDDNTAYDSRLATVFPFNANSPYADVLVNCVYSNSIDFRTSCRFDELPLIPPHRLLTTLWTALWFLINGWGKGLKSFYKNQISKTILKTCFVPPQPLLFHMTYALHIIG
jgi:hypothetical protein